MPLEQNLYGLAEIQRILLAMVKEIDRVCRKHDIPYSIYGGTMLGAVRENGFIPWDDDLDLVFSAEALHNLVAVFPTESDDFTITTTDTWVTRVVPREPVSGNTHPFVDLFHYEPMIAQEKAFAYKLLRLRLLQGMLKEHIELSRYGMKDKLLVLGTHALGLPFSKARKLRWYQQISQGGVHSGGELLHIPDDCFAGIRHRYPRACAQRFEDIVFENITLRVSEEYLQMLTIKYGEDYLTPPPESERCPNHGVTK